MRWLIPIALVACTEHGESPGGGRDGGTNPVSDGSSGSCGKESLVIGELVDWDSSTSTFSGIDGAVLTLVNDPSISTVTQGGGAISICGRSDLPLQFTLDSPGDYPDGTVSIERDVVVSPTGPLTLRAFTLTRAPEFFTEHGLTFDPNRAQVVVELTGDRTQMAIDRPHDAAQAANDDDGDGEIGWSAGDTGRYVLFPNVDVSVASAVVTGDPSGPRAVPIAAGQITMLALSFIVIGP